MKNTDVIIISGGEGTRFKKIQSKPKIITKFKGKKIINIIFNNLNKFNIRNIHILCGKNEKLIRNSINKKKNIFFYKEKKLLGTAGSLSIINRDKLSKDVLIIFGDLLFDIDFQKFYNFHKKLNSDLTIFSHPSDHLYDSDILDVNENNQIKNIFFKPHRSNLITNNITMAGVFIIKKNFLNEIPKNRNNDFSKYLLKKLLKKGKKLICYNSREYCKDFGTPERFVKVKKDYKNKIHKFRSIKNRMPAIFLDRDGVINKDQGPYTYSNPFSFKKNAIKALLKLRKSRYLIFLITNQPSVAKGFISYDYLIQSFKKYELYLSKKGFYFDKIYFCPHHPKKGFQGENLLYKKSCSCRKPKPGLIFKANKEFNLDLKKSYFIGDTANDYSAALNAKVKPIILNKNFKNKKNCKYTRSILEAVNYILNK